MSETLLELKDLSVRYTTDGIISRAVNHVNLKLNKGEVLGLVGETGAGKTTTALSLLSLLQYTSEVEGEILFQGKDLLKLDEKRDPEDPRQTYLDDIPGSDDKPEPGVPYRRTDSRRYQDP